MPITWSRGYDEGDSAKVDGYEWDEVWNVNGFEPPVGMPAMDGLLTSRPDLGPGQRHPLVLTAFVDDFKADRKTKGADAWTVTVRYTTKREAESYQYDIPPTQRAAVIDIAYESVEVPTLTWENGDPILNSAGDLIADVTRTENHWIFAVQKNLAAIPSWILEYADAVNSDSVSVKGIAVPQYHLLLKDLRLPTNPSTEVVNGIQYNFYPISFSLVYNPRNWQTRIFNRGLYEKHPTKGYRRITDDQDEPVDEPQFLGNDGAALSQPVNPSDIVVLEGFHHALKPFSALPLT